MSQFSRREIAEAFVRKYTVTKNTMQQKELISSLVALILDQHMQSDSDIIIREIIEAQARLNSTLAVEIEYNFEPNQQVLDEISKQLKSLTGSKKVIFDKVHRPELLGGVKVKTPKAEIDISLRRQLNDFRYSALNTRVN